MADFKYTPTSTKAVVVLHGGLAPRPQLSMACCIFSEARAPPAAKRLTRRRHQLRALLEQPPDLAVPKAGPRPEEALRQALVLMPHRHVVGRGDTADATARGPRLDGEVGAGVEQQFDSLAESALDGAVERGLGPGAGHVDDLLAAGA
ncbi:hypothetical protein GGTG_06990 [Gaeumannomyces tritici R3-111a-1]|uniref:Uncharacterized protein n=1 Tax=Gaeumannomyces tritici (strain R3-111a-1) TaxID=644352 RepID=J3P0E3_GAET3|nr:hypothetical protein GGTG_06990 [Gaeumannomyces tritici R3-111a-1]EJT77076.1 hypothetical protein GGTG_06990 [Gaeumannomyces tritici R3-111a-1]